MHFEFLLQWAWWKEVATALAGSLGRMLIGYSFILVLLAGYLIGLGLSWKDKDERT